MPAFEASKTTAVLGPTNTGKTHLALERMLGYRSGMIGFPLRLLARENYDRIVEKRGVNSVALITGEEKIIPPQARYFLCTVEAMPADRLVDFLAIDEIQLISDPERGHVFTDRLLNARGTLETMFLGASTVQRLLKKILPEIKYISRPRLSKLIYSGAKKITRLPKKSAIIAFSAQDVYAFAELIRKQRGGAAVVLGALSPRTRNSQVELYQNGEVDYLIATDAIGMGLNMSINHVAFTENTKFDGRIPRYLSSQELAQIAGRAGRHMNDGTFGVTGDCAEFENETIISIEEHSFEPAGEVFWRNTNLSFNSLSELTRSLEIPPPYRFMKKKRDADDHRYLMNLSRKLNIAKKVKNRSNVKLLWDVCQIPDFSKTLSESHGHFLSQIFGYLVSNNGILPDDWIAKQIQRFNRIDGDIDTISSRISHIRTWTYITHRNDWTSDSTYWQEETRSIEDKLSDAMHDKLTQRFVDRRSAILVQKMRDSQKLLAGISGNGEVTVEGFRVGRLAGLNFLPDVDGDSNSKPALTAARKVLPAELTRRVEKIKTGDDKEFKLDNTGSIFWKNSVIAILEAGRNPLVPKITLKASDLVENEQQKVVESRLRNWMVNHLSNCIPALVNSGKYQLSGAARGILFQITESLGTIPRRRVKNLVKSLSEADRKLFSSIGIRFGTETLYFPDLIKPKATNLLAVLWCVFNKTSVPVALLNVERVTVSVCKDLPEEFYSAIGFVRIGGKAIRADIVERLAVILRRSAKKGPFEINDAMLSLLGVGRDDIIPIVCSLGYKKLKSEDEKHVFKRHYSSDHSKKKTKGFSNYRKKKVLDKEISLSPLLSLQKKISQPETPFSALKKFKLMDTR